MTCLPTWLNIDPPVEPLTSDLSLRASQSHRLMNPLKLSEDGVEHFLWLHEEQMLVCPGVSKGNNDISLCCAQGVPVPPRGPSSLLTETGHMKCSDGKSLYILNMWTPCVCILTCTELCVCTVSGFKEKHPNVGLFSSSGGIYQMWSQLTAPLIVQQFQKDTNLPTCHII